MPSAIIKSIAKFFGKAITKSTFAKGVSKVLPVIGGIVSGTITFASLRPMGTRLLNTLDDAHYSYNVSDFETDWRIVEEECAKYRNANGPIEAEGYVSDNNDESEVNVAEEEQTTEKTAAESSILKQIKQAKELLDQGIINAEEFDQIKSKIITGM